MTLIVFNFSVTTFNRPTNKLFLFTIVLQTDLFECAFLGD